jgi:hypothetical protein
VPEWLFDHVHTAKQTPFVRDVASLPVAAVHEPVAELPVSAMASEAQRNVLSASRSHAQPRCRGPADLARTAGNSMATTPAKLSRRFAQVPGLNVIPGVTVRPDFGQEGDIVSGVYNSHQIQKLDLSELQGLAASGHLVQWTPGGFGAAGNTIARQHAVAGQPRAETPVSEVDLSELASAQPADTDSDCIRVCPISLTFFVKVCNLCTSA